MTLLYGLCNLQKNPFIFLSLGPWLYVTKIRTYLTEPVVATLRKCFLVLPTVCAHEHGLLPPLCLSGTTECWRLTLTNGPHIRKNKVQGTVGSPRPSVQLPHSSLLSLFNPRSPELPLRVSRSVMSCYFWWECIIFSGILGIRGKVLAFGNDIGERKESRHKNRINEPNSQVCYPSWTQGKWPGALSLVS